MFGMLFHVFSLIQALTNPLGQNVGKPDKCLGLALRKPRPQTDRSSLVGQG